MEGEAPMADIIVENHGSVFTFEPQSDTAREWVADNVQLEGWQWTGPAFTVDHRFAYDLAQGMLNDGLIVV